MESRRKIFSAFLELSEPFRIVSTLVERLGMDYNYVRRVMDEIRRTNPSFIFPNYRSLGISTGVVIGEKLSLPDKLPLSGATLFLKGKSIAPRIYDVLAYSLDYTMKESFVKETSGLEALVFMDEPLEEEIIDYFREPDRIRMLSIYSTNPLTSLRKIASELKQPFSTVRYVVYRALEEGILHPSLKLMKLPSYYGLSQLLVVSPGTMEADLEIDAMSYLDIATGEFIHDARGEGVRERVYYVRGVREYNLIKFASRRFYSPIPIVSYNINPSKLYESVIEHLQKAERRSVA